jgi:hypothetical protein
LFITDHMQNISETNFLFIVMSSKYDCTVLQCFTAFRKHCTCSPGIAILLLSKNEQFEINCMVSWKHITNLRIYCDLPMDQSDSASDPIIFCVCLANRKWIYFTKLPFFYFPALGYGRKENNLEENDMHVLVTVLFSSAVMTE